MVEVTLKDMQAKVLANRGLTLTKRKRHCHPRMTSSRPLPPSHKKTPLMKYLEEKYGKGQSIWEILISGSLSVVAKALGDEVDVTTISKWLKKYKLKYTATNLPDCNICNRYSTTHCDQGVCKLLIDMEEWNLVILKKQALLSGKNT